MKNAAAVAVAPLLQGTLLEEEVDLETRQVKDGIIRYGRDVADATRRGEGAGTKAGERLVVHNHEVATAAVQSELEQCRAGLPGQGRQIHGPILELVTPDVLAAIALHESLSMCMAEPAGVKQAALCYAIGRAVLAEINMEIMAETDGELLKELDMRFRNLSPGRINWWAGRKVPEAVRTRKGAVHVGAFLVRTLLDYAICNDHMADRTLPMFAREVRREGRKTIGYVTLTEDAWGVLDDGHAIRAVLRPKYLPMLVPPYRWSKEAQGGYVRIRCPFISKPTPTQKHALAEADLEQIYDCLHAVSGTPMRVNRLVLAVQRAYWNSGGNGLGIPRRDPIPSPPRPPGYDAELAGQIGAWRNVDPAAKKAYKREAHKVIEQNVAGRAARKEFLSKHAIAEEFEGKVAIYYPHQLDFRGRAYPIPPHLNHQGDDVARGLLEFAEGKPVDDEGRYWLKVHAANCYGIKGSFDTRVRWVDDNMARIRASAASPLESEWWMHADESRPGAKDGSPWQLLAACFALTDDTVAAHLPVQFDGSANGLQHYAALGRDPEGAAAVNLVPGDEPANLYGDVAAIVRRKVQHDAENADTVVRYTKRTRVGDQIVREPREVPMRQIAALIEPHVTRSTCKPSVMTRLYNVTLIGASHQVLEKLKEAGLTDEGLYCASNYLAKLILEAVGEVCPAAVRIMTWLEKCAMSVAQKKRPVRWKTPLGLPVVQPYRRYKAQYVNTVCGWIRVKFREDDRVPVLPGKQCAGFPPNYIHSLDGTHMLMTARACRDVGVAFAATHDCFLTHAATAGRMRAITREQFVKLHSAPLLDELAEQLRKDNPNATIPDPPERGTFDLSLVLESPYLFG